MMLPTAAALRDERPIPTRLVEFRTSGGVETLLAPAIEAPFLQALQTLVGDEQVCGVAWGASSLWMCVGRGGGEAGRQ